MNTWINNIRNILNLNKDFVEVKSKVQNKDVESLGNALLIAITCRQCDTCKKASYCPGILVLGKIGDTCPFREGI